MCPMIMPVVLPPLVRHASQPDEENTASMLNKLSTATIIQMVRSPRSSAAMRLPSDIYCGFENLVIWLSVIGYFSLVVNGQKSMVKIQRSTVNSFW
jgi:hypothetical protein